MAKQTFTTGQVLLASQMTSLQQTAMGGGEATPKTASYVLVAADAGTTVIMNSGSATTITINTSLFAAGDTVNIQNIGAGICTITAGTATVDTAGSLALGQYEGGVLYFRSTSAATFFDYVQTGSVSPLTTKGDLYGFSTLDARIPIGTNNQVLTADSAQALGLKWATPTGANKSYSLLSTTALTGSATITVSSLSGYDNFLIQIQNGAGVANNNYARLRINTDTGANYTWAGLTARADSIYTVDMIQDSFSNTATSFELGYMTGGGGQTNFSSGISILGGNSTGFKQVSIAGSPDNGQAPSSSGQIAYIVNGIYKGSAVISSISVISSSGNFSQGNIYVYGAV
jgi:hypothetical protein